MPLPPDTEMLEVPKLQFSHMECLMFTFHKLCKQCPDFLTKDQEQLKEFRSRLQYFARGIQGYIKKLREAINGKDEEELKSDENQLKVVALKTTNNINTLIKDLFHSPPSFKSVVNLSWKTVAVSKKVISHTYVFCWILSESWFRSRVKKRPHQFKRDTPQSLLATTHLINVLRMRIEAARENCTRHPVENTAPVYLLPMVLDKQIFCFMWSLIVVL